MKNHFIVTTFTFVAKDTEYSFKLPVATQSYTLKTRGNTEFKVGYKAGCMAAGDYLTIPAGNCEAEDGMNRPDPLTIYVSCEKTGEILEIKYAR